MTNPTLREHLVAAARKAGYPALDTTVRGVEDGGWVAIVQAGMAAELLLRAVVADLSPGLLFLTNTRPAETVAALRATEELASILNARTTNAQSITALAAAAHPAIAAIRAEADAVADLRNSVVHMFAFGPADHDRAIDGLVRIVEAAAPCIGVSVDDFWGGERSALAREVRERADDETRSALARKIRAAILGLEQLRSNMTEEQYHELLAVRRRHMPLTQPSDRVEAADCPACFNAVLVIRRTTDLLGPRDVAEIELTDWGEDGPQTALFPQIVIHQEMKCAVCGLALSGDELGRAINGFDNPWDVEPRRGTIEEYEAAIGDFEPPFD